MNSPDGAPNASSRSDGTESAADRPNPTECEPPPSHQQHQQKQQQQQQQTNNDKTQAKGSSGGSKKRRPTCPRCSRPLRVCICAALPDEPVTFRRCRVVVLQHPHEGRRKNRSVPLVELCVAGGGGADGSEGSFSSSDFHLRTIVHRRLGDEVDPSIMKLVNDPDGDVVLVYPSPDAVSLSQGLAEVERRRSERRAARRARRLGAATTAAAAKTTDSAGPSDGDKEEGKITLLFLDATWKYAREMERKNTAGKWWPEDLIRVKLSPSGGSLAGLTTLKDGQAEVHAAPAEGTDTANENSPSDEGNDNAVQLEQQRSEPKEPGTAAGMADVIADRPEGYRPRRFDIRTPPTSEHLSTAECVAWVVSAVEDDPSIYRTLMKPLDLMVEKWKSFSDDDGWSSRGGGSCRGRRGFTDGDGPMEEGGEERRGGGRSGGRGGGKRRRRK